MELPKVCTNRISEHAAGGFTHQPAFVELSRLRQMLGGARGSVEAVFVYGDEIPTAPTTQMPQAPEGFDFDFPLQTRKFTKGFTMIEVMVVMGLLVIVGSLGMFMSMENLRSGAFRNDRNAAVSALQRARSLAVNNMCFDGGGVVCTDGKPHGVRFDPAAGGITIFQISSGETDFDNRDEAADEFIAFDSRTTAIDAAKTIIFDRLSGKSAAASVILSDGAAHNSEININSEGRIDWTN